MLKLYNISKFLPFYTFIENKAKSMEQTFCLLILEVMEQGTRAEKEIQK